MKVYVLSDSISIQYGHEHVCEVQGAFIAGWLAAWQSAHSTEA